MLQTTEKPERKALSDEDLLPLDEFRHRLYLLASDARLIFLAARAVNEDDGAGGGVDNCDADDAYAIERAAERIEARLLGLAGGLTLDSLTGKAVAS